VHNGAHHDVVAQLPAERVRAYPILDEVASFQFMSENATVDASVGITVMEGLHLAGCGSGNS